MLTYACMKLFLYVLCISTVSDAQSSKVGAKEMTTNKPTTKY